MTTVAPVLQEVEPDKTPEAIGGVVGGVVGSVAGAAAGGPVGKYAGGFVGKGLAKLLFGGKKTPQVRAVQPQVFREGQMADAAAPPPMR